MIWLVEHVRDYDFFLKLFLTVLAITAWLHVTMLLYFRGVFGLTEIISKIWWDGETESWLINILLTCAGLIFLFGGTAYVWFLAVTVGVLITVALLAYMILRLASHDLPEWLFWIIFAIIALSAIVGLIVGFLVEPPPIDILTALAVAAFFVFVACIICLIITLVYKLVRAIVESIVSFFGFDGPTGQPIASGVSAAASSGVVDNPNGALADPGGPGTGAPAVVHADSCITVDFGDRKIVDRWFKPDLRILSAPSDAKISVEVSNDNQNWESCSKDSNVPTDWNVPWYNSPWRYVRICNLDPRSVSIWDVFALSR